MKFLNLFMLSIFGMLLGCHAQPAKDQTERIKNINSIFERIEVQGVDSKSDLLYGYFFLDTDKIKLEKLQKELQRLSFHLVDLVNNEKGLYMLHVEKIEHHTRATLLLREQEMDQMAKQYQIQSYDGFDVGNADPSKPLISRESFAKYVAHQQDRDLFVLGIKLYNLEMVENAEFVFRECIRKHIIEDTSSYKLGNILLRQFKVDEAIAIWEQTIVVNPGYERVYFNLGAVCYDYGKFEKSIYNYQQANKLKPNDAEIIYGIAASQFGNSDFKNSLLNCKRVLIISPSNDNAKQLLAMLKSKGFE